MRALSLLAATLCLNPSLACASKSGPYAVDLIDQNGGRLATYSHDGRTYVLGHQGERYSLRIRNHTAARVEIVASVDGRDVLDGSPGNWSKRGYVVDPWGQVIIEGFRLDHDSVAAFRFGSVGDSYAAQMGDARDVGVIGVAVFVEKDVHVVMRQALENAPSRDPESAGAPSNVFGPGGLGTGLNNVLGGLQGGAGMGDAHGVGGLGSRGDGYGNIDLGGRGKGDTRIVPGRMMVTFPNAGPKLGREKHPEAAPFKKGAPIPTPADDRPGLATEFGERHSSHVNDVDFDRASYSPAARLTLRYDDRRGLVALGIPMGPSPDEIEARRRENAQPFRASFCTPPPGSEGAAAENHN